MGCENGCCEIEEYPTKRDLDGCYFRVERNGKWENICFSDLTEAERGKVMANKGIPWVISLCGHLANSLRAFGEAFDVVGRDE